MKKRLPNPVIPNYQPKADRMLEKELTLNFSACCVCGGKIGYGFYGRHGDGGTCSGKREREMQSRPKDFGEPKGGVTCIVQDAKESSEKDRQK